MVHIDPLELAKTTHLRCFREVFQDQLVRYLEIFLHKQVGGNKEKGRKSARSSGRARGRVRT